MRHRMDEYGAAVLRIAGDCGAAAVDTQAAFGAALATTAPRDWAPDRVHPEGPGHAVIALALLRAIGFAL
jgi:hypothetical protein